MKFIVDAQLPPALAYFLASLGHEARHVIEIGLAAAEDEAIWNHAQNARAVIVTKDEDFAVRRTMNATGPAIVWIRLGNSTKQELMRWFAPLFPEILAAIDNGETLIEVT